MGGPLGAVHEEGLLHRDVKAQNVMRDEKGRLVLGDFGTGRGTVDRVGREEGPVHDVAGTPLYFAPEIFRREPATVQSDLYSLGVLLYHLVTGAFPVRGRSMRQLRDTHDLGSGRPLAEAHPELPDPFVQIVDRALDPESGRRYANAAEMEAALVAWVSPPRAGSRFWRVAASAAAVLILVIGAATWSGLLPLSQRAATTTGAPLAFEERDWVLLADFENTTGEEVFDGAIDAALFERELRNSSFVNIVPRERVVDALVLMRKPVETRLDTEVALEVALRDGQIRAVVGGRVDRRGSGYLLTASVMNLNGATVASSSEEAVDEDEVLSAMGRLSNWLRAALGETITSVEASNQPLQQVTTPSLQALRLYSLGYELYVQQQVLGVARLPGGHAGAVELFRRAIAEDPGFAMAHNMLGYSVRFDDPDEALVHWARAVELAPNTAQRDQLFIEGTYLDQTGHPEEAAAKFETLLALHPDHYYAVNNLTGIYDPRNFRGDRDDWVRDHSDDYLRVHAHRAEQRPNHFMVQFQAARAHMQWAAQSDRWRRYAMRASVVKPLTLDEWQFGSLPREQVGRYFVWLNFVPADVHWSRGEIDEAYQALESLTRSIDTQPPEVREQFLTQAGAYRLAFGQVQHATDLFERLSDADVRASRLGWVASCVDDRAAMQEQLITLSPGTQATAADPADIVARGLLRPLRVVRAGLPLDRFDFSPDTPHRQLALGELAFRRGDLAEAVERFEQGLEGLGESFHALDFFVASESLASALQGVGNEPRVLRVLEVAARRAPLRTVNLTGFLTGAFGRFRVQARLASEYRKLGRVDEAEAIENEVLRMLKYADADHPIVRQINESRESR